MDMDAVETMRSSKRGMAVLWGWREERFALTFGWLRSLLLAVG
jgi:hypothetical protein